MSSRTRSRQRASTSNGSGPSITTSSPASRPTWATATSGPRSTRRSPPRDPGPGHADLARQAFERRPARLRADGRDARRDRRRRHAVAYNRVGGVVVTGNEDGAHHVISELSSNLSDIGFTIPGQAFTYWNKGPGPGRRLPRHQHGHPYSETTGKAAASNILAVAKALQANPVPAPPSGLTRAPISSAALNVEVADKPLAEVDAGLARRFPLRRRRPSRRAGGRARRLGGRGRLSQERARSTPRSPTSVVVIGLGKREDFTPERARVAAAIAAQSAAKRKATSLAIDGSRTTGRGRDRRGAGRGRHPRLLPVRPLQVEARRARTARARPRSHAWRTSTS